MSEKLFYTGINLQGNYLKNAVVHPSTTEPSNATEGQFYYNTTTNKIYVYNGSAWDEVGTAPLTIASDSSSFLSIVNGELHFSNVAITEVHVDTDNATLSAFIAAHYTVGNEFNEGDVVILTAATDQGQRTWIHNGGTAANANDFTALTSTVSTSIIREAISGVNGITYTSATGEIELTDGGVSTAKIADDAITTAKILDGNVTTAKILDANVTQAKLEATLEAKIVTSKQQLFGNGTLTSFTFTHNLNTPYISVSCYKVSTGDEVSVYLNKTNDNVLEIGAFPAFATNDLLVIVDKKVIA